jgi:glutamyl-tRNA synthetase
LAAKLAAMSTSNSPSAIRVRMAPSPTGYFHVGSARTALFNYLFARHTGGTFVLRIEDTDQQRNDPAYETVIYQALEWLGMDADESPHKGGEFGPYRQSERFDLYREYAKVLLEAGQAYYAYETSAELDAMRAEQRAQKQPPRYNGAHRDLTAEQRAAYEAEGRKPVLRLRVPDGETAWEDAVYGNISWRNSELDDFVIMKSDTTATYNFACVIDDALMKISHVIRGEDGLSNTPRQILIYQALGFAVPTFAHLPFLLGPDRKKLSKRNAPTNLLDYRDKGFLQDAVISYLALLGWNPGGADTQEIWSREELFERFSLEGVNKSGAIFDVEKLAWMNTQFLKALPIDEFIERVKPEIEDFLPSPIDDYTRQAMNMARERMHALIETQDNVKQVTHALGNIRDGSKYFFSDDFALDATGVAKHLTETALPRLQQLRERLSQLPDWTHEAIEAALRELAGELGIKPAELVHPTRMAVSGRTVGPSLWELLEVLGRERTLRRLDSISQRLAA